MGEDSRFLRCEDSRGRERGVGFGAGDVEAGGLKVIPGGEGGFVDALVDAFFLQEVFEGGADVGILLHGSGCFGLGLLVGGGQLRDAGDADLVFTFAGLGDVVRGLHAH